MFFSLFHSVASNEFSVSISEIPGIAYLPEQNATRFITEKQAVRIVQALGAFCSDYQKEALEGETFVGNRTRTEERSVLVNAGEIRSAIRNKRKISFQYSTATIDDVKKTVLRRNGSPS